jgi:hypothetical protein
MEDRAMNNENHRNHPDRRKPRWMVAGFLALVAREALLIGIPAALLHWLAPVFGLAAMSFVQAAGIVILFRIVLFVIRGRSRHSRWERCCRYRTGVDNPGATA